MTRFSYGFPFPRRRALLLSVLTLTFLAMGSVALAYTFTAIDAPGATRGTSAYGINNHGVIMGYCQDPQTETHGFVRAINGTFTTVDVMGPGGTQAFGVNGKGQIGEGPVRGRASSGKGQFVGVYFDLNLGTLRGFIAVP